MVGVAGTLGRVVQELAECERRGQRLRRRARELGLPRVTARGMGTLYLRGPVWWLALWSNGQRVRMSTGVQGGSPGHPPKEAELFRARKLLELGRGGLVGLTADTLTVDGLLDILIDRYRAEKRKTCAATERRLAHLRERHGGWKVRDFTLDRMLSYAVRRRDQDRAAVATVNLEMAYLRRAFTVAVEAGRLHLIPRVPRLPGARVRQGFIEPHQYEAILEAIAPFYRPLIRFLRLTGWRESEALGLEWSRVSWVAEEIRLDDSKTGEPRALPFSRYPALRDLLLAQRNEADAVQLQRGSIVPTVFFKPTGEPILRGGLQSAWSSARDKAGYPHLILHDFRRTLVRDMERAGVPRSVAMAVTGHRSEVVYRRYAIVARQDVEDGLAKLAQATPPQPVVVNLKAGR